MKKLLTLLLALSLPAVASATIGLQPSYPINSWLNGNTTGIITSSSTPYFPSFSFTIASGTNATTTNFGITGVLSKLLKTDSSGYIVGATAGTDYLASMTFAWPWTKQADNAQATSTLLELFGGLFTNASSTLASTTVGTLLATNGTTTNFAISNIASSLLKTSATGSVIPAILGTDYINSSDQNYKEAAKYATTAALPANNYTNGASGVGATIIEIGTGALSVDGATPSVGDRILVKNEGTAANNGIYTVTVVGSGIAAFTLTRATDFNQSADIMTGDALLVTAGTLLTNTTWAYTGIDSPTVGTNSITFTQVSGSGVGGSFAYPFLTLSTGEQATSTALAFFNGFLSTASSTINSTLFVTGSSTLQTTSIIALRNLGTNGFVKTSGGTGSLSVDTNTYLTGMTFAFPWKTLSTNENATSTTLAFLNGFLSTASSTLANATSTNFNVTQPTLSFGSTGSVYVGSTTARTLAFASSTLDASGFSPNMGNATTTLPLGVSREGTKILGIGCQASTTAGVAGGFLIKLGTLPSTFTETVFCDTNYREYNLTTNPQIAGHIPLYAFISKASSSPQTGFVTEIFQKVSTGAN